MPISPGRGGRMHRSRIVTPFAAPGGWFLLKYQKPWADPDVGWCGPWRAWYGTALPDELTGSSILTPLKAWIGYKVAVR